MGPPFADAARPEPDRCPACGAAGTGGLAGCRTLVNELLLQAQADARYAGVYRLAFDAYCLQHPDEFCLSAKSYAAHLVGLCHGLEQAERPQTYWAIPRWLGARAPHKPPVLAERGSRTIADLHDAGSPEDHARRVRAWAEDVWRAYQSQHALAREWLRQALGE